MKGKGMGAFYGFLEIDGRVAGLGMGDAGIKKAWFLWVKLYAKHMGVFVV